MRLAPAFGICWLATVALLAGCSTWKAVSNAGQVLPAKVPPVEQTAGTGRAAFTSGRSHGSQVHVPHLDDSGIRRSRGGDDNEFRSSGISAEIEREMAAVKAEWEERCREMRSVRPAPPTLSEPGRGTAPGPKDVRVTDRMLAVERKYAPRYLNCGIRIRLLESQIADASGQTRDALLRKLERAKSELAAVDKACITEMELARLDTAPSVGKDEEVLSSKQDSGTSPDANAGADIYRDQKAGGGAD